MAYVRNLWYVAAFADEIHQQLFARTVCDVPLLLYRDENGELVALHDRCPHRFAPLSIGRRQDGAVRCGYHGLVFDRTGNCIFNPHSANGKAERVSVRAYSVRERYGLAWVWFGEADNLDERLIPDFSCLKDSEHFATVKGVLHVRGHYELITDNLVDLSHVEFLHDGLLGSEAISRGKHEVRQHGRTIHSDRWCPNGLAPPAWDRMFGDYGKPVDHWLNMRWDPPAHMLLDVGITPTGAHRDDGVWIFGTDIITPETETSSHYFWAVSRTNDIHDEEVGRRWMESIEIAFARQDKPMIEAVQARMGNQSFDEAHPRILEPDRGAMRCRLAIKRLLKEESARPTNSAGIPSTTSVELSNTAMRDIAQQLSPALESVAEQPAAASRE